MSVWKNTRLAGICHTQYLAGTSFAKSKKSFHGSVIIVTLLVIRRCLDHLLRHICPLCRSQFSPQEVRRLHVDLQSESPTVTTADDSSGPRLGVYVLLFQGRMVITEFCFHCQRPICLSHSVANIRWIHLHHLGNSHACKTELHACSGTWWLVGDAEALH
jgi:hypothetical protein